MNENIQDQTIFVNVFQNRSVGAALLNRDGTFRRVNAAFCTFIGYVEEELKQMRFQQITSNEDLENDLRLNEQLLEGEIPFYQTEKRFLHRLGYTVVGDLHLSVYWDAAIRESFLIAQVIDITDKRVYQEEAERFKLLYNCVNEGIALFDTTGRVVQVNRAFEDMFGWKEAEVVGKRLPVTPSITQDDAEFLVTETHKGKSISGFETIKQHKNGELFPVSISMTPVRNHSGEVTGLAGVVRNITEQKMAHELLLQSEKLATAGQMAAGIAHEIRNPITAISGFLQLMLDRGEYNENHVRIMKSETERISLILNELLYLAKPQPQKQVYVHIQMLLDQVVSVMEAHSNFANIEIVKDYEESPIHLTCDPNQIKQVCINILKNAIEAMPQGGRLVIGLKREGHDYVRIRITDNGIGMPKELLDKLGQPFHSTKESGTGLGFMISKSIINQHGGTIRVTSEENKGTNIEITLKLNADSTPDGEPYYTPDHAM